MLGPVVSSYKVPVIVRKVSRGGKPIDYGPFRRLVVIEDEDSGTRVEATVTGLVESQHLKVGNEEDNGVLRFDDFDRTQGKTRTIELRTDKKDLKLEVDTARTSGFLDVKLPPNPTPAAGGWFTWELTVTVRKNSDARGRFPDLANPTLHDCAVYLHGRSEEGDWHHRIPVAGNAQSR